MFLTGLNENLKLYVFTLINNFKSNININHLLNALQNLSRRQNNEKKLKFLIVKFNNNKPFNNRFKSQNNDFKEKKNKKNKNKEKICEHCKISEYLKDKCYFLHLNIKLNN